MQSYQDESGCSTGRIVLFITAVHTNTLVCHKNDVLQDSCVQKSMSASIFQRGL